MTKTMHKLLKLGKLHSYGKEEQDELTVTIERYFYEPFPITKGGVPILTLEHLDSSDTRNEEWQDVADTVPCVVKQLGTSLFRIGLRIPRHFVGSLSTYLFIQVGISRKPPLQKNPSSDKSSTWPLLAVQQGLLSESRQILLTVRVTGVISALPSYAVRAGTERMLSAYSRPFMPQWMREYFDVPLLTRITASSAGICPASFQTVV